MAWVENLVSLWVERFRSQRGLTAGPSADTPLTEDTVFDWEAVPGQRSFLHVGCGGSTKEHAAPGFRGDDWREIRLDRARSDPLLQNLREAAGLVDRARCCVKLKFPRQPDEFAF